MIKYARQTLHRLAYKCGISVERVSRHQEQLPDMEAEFFELAKRCRPFTMTSYERLYALYGAVSYVVRRQIPGDVVECGVWKGGSSMLAASSLRRLGETTRSLYLYDTFEGMSEPTAADVRVDGTKAEDQMADREWRDWLAVDLPEVRRNLATTDYPSERLIYVRGRVEDTIPDTLPERIAILRLDTDWYESTYHEMTHLYPRLSVGGVLILDDYGCYRGARKAVDEYFEENDIVPLLNRIDYSGRMMLKRAGDQPKAGD